MPPDDETLHKIDTWWESLSAEDRALVKRHEQRPTDDERVRELVARSGFPMIYVGVWNDRHLYKMPPEILAHLQDPSTVFD